MEIGKVFLIIGGLMLLIGIVYTVWPGISFPPRLPGDIFIKGEKVTIYFPIVTSILLSIILTIILNLIMRK